MAQQEEITGPFVPPVLVVTLSSYFSPLSTPVPPPQSVQPAAGQPSAVHEGVVYSYKMIKVS